MKKLFTILILFLSTSYIFAQAPQKMSFQAIIRNASNALITNQTVGVRISILQGSTNGQAVYVEVHSPASNVNGLINLEIGNGTVISGTFSSISWKDGPYFIKTETDPSGGTNYSITGTSQLLSVPYALHAKTAESFTGNSGSTGDVLVWNGTGWAADNNQITISNSNVVMNNSFSFSDGFFLAYFANNHLTFVNDHSYIQIFPNSSASNRIVTLPNGETNGQTLILACHWNTGANGFRLESTGNIKLNGGGTLDFYPNDTIMLIWNGQSWTEVSRSDN